jgi:hypothetical protein
MFAGFFGDDDQMIDDGDDGDEVSVCQIEKDLLDVLLHLLVFDLDPLHVSDA